MREVTLKRPSRPIRKNTVTNKTVTLGDFRFWHLSDVGRRPLDVRYRVNTADGEKAAKSVSAIGARTDIARIRLYVAE